jgi:hypothetical protein
MPRSLTLACALFAWACTDIPDPAGVPITSSAGGGGGAPPEPIDVPYTEPCERIGRVVARAVTPMGFLPGAAPGSAVNAWPGLVGFGDDPTNWRIELFAVGLPEELRGVERPLGVGVNADLSTCVHCLVVHRGCDAVGDNCQSGPYYPRAGVAAATQMADTLGRVFAMEMRRVELVPVTIDPSLHVTPSGGDESCVYFEHIAVTAATLLINAPCSVGYHCPLAADAGNRHPD